MARCYGLPCLFGGPKISASPVGRSGHREFLGARCATPSNGRSSAWLAIARVSMRAMSVGVVRIATRSPGDVSGLLSLIQSGEIDPRSILAILGKTEGNGGVNDFTREFAVYALCAALAPYLDLPPQGVDERIAFVMSGGTE